MPPATPPARALTAADWQDRAFDMTRGIAVYTGSSFIAGIARVIARHPEADIGTAFNHKQLACKMWARDALCDTLGGRFRRIWIVGGWYGVLAAMLLEDRRFEIAEIASIDIDPAVAEVAQTLVENVTGGFSCTTADMYALDYAAGKPDLVINTSCEHIADLRQWLALLPKATPVLLQSNNYFSEPSHISSMATLTEFAAAAALGHPLYSGELPQKNYTRFMLIGRT